MRGKFGSTYLVAGRDQSSHDPEDRNSKLKVKNFMKERLGSQVVRDRAIEIVDNLLVRR